MASFDHSKWQVPRLN